jgi:hypothetical protein
METERIEQTLKLPPGSSTERDTRPRRSEPLQLPKQSIQWVGRVSAVHLSLCR